MEKEEKNKTKKVKKNNKKNNNKDDRDSNRKNKIEGTNKKNINRNTFHNYLWYIIIFSIIGLLIEIPFYFITIKSMGSTKGLILGPLCPIYGLETVILISLLDRYKENKFKLLIYGTILGAIVGYLISFILEAVCGVRFWDYLYARFNLNGRICLTYSILCGLISIFVIGVAKKWIDKLINKIKGKFIKVIDIILTIILVIDIGITVWGVTVYAVRAKDTLNGKNYISNNNIIEKFQNTVFSNEHMERIFPNLCIVDNNGNKVYIRNIFNEE